MIVLLLAMQVIIITARGASIHVGHYLSGRSVHVADYGNKGNSYLDTKMHKLKQCIHTCAGVCL